MVTVFRRALESKTGVSKDVGFSELVVELVTRRPKIMNFSRMLLSVCCWH